MTTPGGSTRNILQWFVPNKNSPNNWDVINWALIDSKYNSRPTRPDMNPYFENTFSYGYSPNVKYYLLYGNLPGTSSTLNQLQISLRNVPEVYDSSNYNNWFN